MKLRDEFAEILHDELLLEAAHEQAEALEDIIESLVEKVGRATAIQIETKAGCYAAFLAEEAFLIGFEMPAYYQKLIVILPEADRLRIFFDELSRREAAKQHEDALDELLKGLRKRKMLDRNTFDLIDTRAGCYALNYAEAAFMIGLDMGANPHKLLCKE